MKTIEEIRVEKHTTEEKKIYLEMLSEFHIKAR